MFSVVLTLDLKVKSYSSILVRFFITLTTHYNNQGDTYLTHFVQ